jgi:hypothetical protein
VQCFVDTVTSFLDEEKKRIVHATEKQYSRSKFVARKRIRNGHDLSLRLSRRERESMCVIISWPQSKEIDNVSVHATLSLLRSIRKHKQRRLALSLTAEFDIIKSILAGRTHTVAPFAGLTFAANGSILRRVGR